ncbi:rhodanese-like domain-containing protein [Shewanella sedimentimangrovi]|uniref:Rhodanese-like domain-containing protein n=1 Tax=Shewanella sedimentimangrovi TaxID=2814293 RepID=A0ABX7QYP6_9GAMM|nr:rhodanese-like domain-containing protein [Shewanella sedimentimangrovi]QSX35970.1 rhodanese-like domain-containing protein [Shewanella sedimentimangrovi]
MKLLTLWRGLVLCLTLLLPITSWAGEGKDPAVAWQKIQAGAMVVDVRTAEEYAAGHLEGAINIPFERIAAEFAKRGIAKDAEVVLYCRSGRRSGIAQDSLMAEGYEHTYNGGGFESLAAAKP